MKSRSVGLKDDVFEKYKTQGPLDLESLIESKTITCCPDLAIQRCFGIGPESTYNGQVDSLNRAHGIGRLIFGNGVAIYEGELYEGRRHGYGRMISNNLCYEGQWQFGNAWGEAKLTLNDGMIQQGHFENGTFTPEH